MEFYIRPICVGDGKGINELRRMPGVFKIIGEEFRKVRYKVCGGNC